LGSARDTSFRALLGDAPSGICAALIGGGGKTGLLLALGRELVSSHERVLLTSLVEMEADLDMGDGPGSDAEVETALEQPTRSDPVHFFGHRTLRGKLSGVGPIQLDRWRRRADATLFECDGSRGMPLKAHNDRDPRVPAFATHAVAVVGADAVGATLASGHIHRPELFRERWGVGWEEPLTVERIAEVLTSRKGYVGQMPGTVDVTCFINKADLAPDTARELAAAVREISGWRVGFGSLREGWLEMLP